MAYYSLETARKKPNAVKVLGLKGVHVCTADFLLFPNLNLLRLEDCSLELTQGVAIPYLEDLLITFTRPQTLSRLAFLPHVFKNIKSLHLEYISNSIEIKGHIHAFSRLEKLIINEGKLDEFPFSTGMASLRYLDLGGNELREINDVVGKFPSLASLKLSANNIQRISAKIGKLSKLHTLHLEGNQLDRFPRLNELPNLMELNLAHNNFSTVPPVLYRSKLLWYLNISGNPIEKLPKELSDLPSLRTLRASKCKIRQLPQNFSNLRSLKYLYLNQNQLARFPQVICEHRQLVELHLQNNQIKKLPKNIEQLQYLRKLYLDGNLLKDLPSSLVKLSRLRNLSLERNDFTVFPKVILQLPMAEVKGLSQRRFIKKMSALKSLNEPKVTAAAYQLLAEKDSKKSISLNTLSKLSFLDIPDLQNRVQEKIAKKYGRKKIKSVLLKGKKICFSGVQITDSQLFAEEELRFVEEVKSADICVLGKGMSEQILNEFKEQNLILLSERSFYHKYFKEFPAYLTIQENSEMRQNAVELFHSSDKENKLLALNIMLTGGLPTACKTHVINLAIEWGNEPENKALVLQVCQLYLSSDELLVAEYFWGIWLDEYSRAHAQSLNTLKQMCEGTDLSFSDFYAFNYHHKKRHELPF